MNEKGGSFDVLTQAQKILDEAQGRQYLRDQENGKVETKISKELLSEQQQFFDWLGLDYDLNKEIKENGFLALDPRQEQESIKQGLSLSLIMPSIPRNKFIEAIAQKFYSILQSSNYSGVRFGEGVREYNYNIQSEPNNSRPYQLRLEDVTRTKDAHFKTMAKPFSIAQAQLSQFNQQNPNLHLRGLSLPEYLLFQAHTLYRLKKQNSILSDQEFKEHVKTEMPDWDERTWLLEEQARDNNGNSDFCLEAGFYPGHHHVAVNIADSRDHLRTRFVVVHKSS